MVAPPPPERSRLLMPTLVGMSFLFHFLILGGYYIIRPVRDEIGATHRDVIAELWTAVFFVMLIAVPLYTAIIARLPRRVFLPLVYLFLALNLGAFYLMLSGLEGTWLRWVEYSFYIWNSVINLLAVSVFWSFMSDVYTTGQSKRWFGPLAMGGSLGAIAGSWFVAQYVELIGREQLLLISAIAWIGAACCIGPISRIALRAGRSGTQPTPMRSVASEVVFSITSAARGLSRIASSPYLLGIAVYILILTLGNSFLYLQRLALVREFIADRDERAAFGAKIDLFTNLATLPIQGFIVMWIIRLIGIGWTLSLLPVINLVGFFILGAYMLDELPELRDRATVLLSILIAFEVAQRVGRYALARPSRESLYTVVDHQARYQSKAFIDTAVYRGGDVAWAWVFEGLTRPLALSLGAAALATLPAFAAGIGLSVLLGAAHLRRAQAEQQPGRDANQAPPTTIETT